VSTELKGSGVKSQVSFSFLHGKSAIDVVIYLHTMNLISKSCSHVGDRFVGDEEGIRDLGCDPLLTEKVYKAMAGMVPGMTAEASSLPNRVKVIPEVAPPSSKLMTDTPTYTFPSEVFFAR
jgi:hypothetical protein